MSRWHVRLIGEKFDLEEFPEFFTSPDLRVVELEGDYYLEAESLEAFEEPGDVHEAAGRLLLILNGVARLRIGNFRRIRMGAIVENTANGTRRSSVSMTTDAVVARARIKSRGIVVGDAEEATQPGPQETDQWAALAMCDENAEKMLRIWSTRTHDWVNLSNILDVMDRRRIRSNKWATEGELKRFDQSANDPRHAADDARHGVSSGVKTPRRPYMSLVEAERFIELLLVAWFRARS